MLRPRSTTLLAIALGAALGVVASGAWSAGAVVGPSVKPIVVPITPFRLVDTRPAPGDPAGGPNEPFLAGQTRTYAVAGVGAVPAGAVGVVLNVTTLQSSGAGMFLTVFPAGATRPTASTLNPTPGQVSFNAATVALGTGGAFSVYNFTGQTHVIIDVVAYLVDHNHDDVYVRKDAPVFPTVIETGPGTASSFAAAGGADNYAGTISVPPGRWLISYTVTVVNFSGTSDLFRCGLVRGFTGLFAMTTSRVGPGNDVLPHSSQLTLTVPAGPNESIRVGCRHDTSMNGGVGLLGNVYMENGVISALAVAP